MIKLELIRKCPSVIDSLVELSWDKLKFVVDTRKIQGPCALVAIPGARFNPLEILKNKVHLDCKIVFYEKNSTNDFLVNELKISYQQTFFIPITNAVTFLQEITSLHIRDWQDEDSKHVVFAISGSNGKTTHKEMLSYILNQVIPGKVVATEKNNNNHLGVPLTILEVSSETEFLILELGSNHPGEIKVLCDISHPTSGITTNIGATHLEFFGSEEAVFQEEGYLFYSVKNNTSGKGFFLINQDDLFLSKFKATDGSVTYGESANAQAQIKISNQLVELSYQEKNFSVENNFITGKHNKKNLITCAFIAVNFYSDKLREIISAAGEFKPTKNRSEWIKFREREIFLDAYNANPSSMKAALEAFKDHLSNQKIDPKDALVVLGDMNELGENSPHYHQEIGAYLDNLGFINAIFVGRFGESYLKGFPSGRVYASTREFKDDFVNKYLQSNEIHFIKGSRSLQLESLFDIN